MNQTQSIRSRGPSDRVLFETEEPLELTAAARKADIEQPEFDSARAINRQRWVMIGVICAIFLLLNGVVCYLINKTIDLEFALMASGRVLESSQRIVTNGVFMALIGATVVQTGLVIRGISNFLFRDEKNGA